MSIWQPCTAGVAEPARWATGLNLLRSDGPGSAGQISAPIAALQWRGTRVCLQPIDCPYHVPAAASLSLLPAAIAMLQCPRAMSSLSRTACPPPSRSTTALSASSGTPRCGAMPTTSRWVLLPMAAHLRPQQEGCSCQWLLICARTRRAAALPGALCCLQCSPGGPTARPPGAILCCTGRSVTRCSCQPTRPPARLPACLLCSTAGTCSSPFVRPSTRMRAAWTSSRRVGAAAHSTNQYFDPKLLRAASRAACTSSHRVDAAAKAPLTTMAHHSLLPAQTEHWPARTLGMAGLHLRPRRVDPLPCRLQVLRPEPRRARGQEGHLVPRVGAWRKGAAAAPAGGKLHPACLVPCPGQIAPSSSTWLAASSAAGCKLQPGCMNTRVQPAGLNAAPTGAGQHHASYAGPFCTPHPAAVCLGLPRRRWPSSASSTTGSPSRSTGPSRMTLGCSASSWPTTRTAPPPSSTGARPHLLLLQGQPLTDGCDPAPAPLPLPLLLLGRLAAVGVLLLLDAGPVMGCWAAP